MRYKRRFVTVYRDFPEGCGVASRHISNADESLMQSKFKEGSVVRDHGDYFPDIKEASSNHSKNKTCRIEDLLNQESIIESNASVKDHQEEEGIGECEDKQNQTSLVKKRCLSSHNSTMEDGTDVVDTSSKIVIVSGLAAESNCPWRQLKNRGSRQVNRGSRQMNRV